MREGVLAGLGLAIASGAPGLDAAGHRSGFKPALYLMAAMLGAVLADVLVSLPRELGKAKASKSFAELFAKSRAINLLASTSSAATDVSFSNVWKPRW